MTEEIDTPMETHQQWALRRRREAMVVSRPQAVHALRLAGLLDPIETYIATTATDLERDAWENAVIFSRASPVVASMAAEIGITDEQLDDLFALGASIKV